MIPSLVVASPKKLFGVSPCKKFIKNQQMVSDDKSADTNTVMELGENMDYDVNELCVSEDMEKRLCTKLNLPCYLESESECSGSEYYPSDPDDSTCLGDIEAILSRYNRYLVGPCRNKSMETSATAVQNIRRICATLDVGNMSDLFNQHRELLLNKYLGKMCCTQNKGILYSNILE